MAQYEETTRNALIILKLPPLAFDCAPTECSKELEQRIRSALDRGDLLIDLSEIEGRGDLSGGERVLIIGAKAGRSMGRKILLAAPSAIFREKLLISRFDVVFPIFDALDDAIDAYETGSMSKAIGRYKIPAAPAE